MHRNPLTLTFDLLALLKGFVLLTLALLPITLMLTLYIGIMAGGAPNAPSPLASFGLVAVYIYLVPLGVVLWHLLAGKAIDAVLRIVPLRRRAVSVSGLGIAAVLLVIAGNIWVDNLYQFRQGDYTLSVMALVADLAGMGLVAGLGLIRIPFVDRIFRLKS